MVLNLLAKGCTQKQIAASLKVSKATVSRKVKFLVENGFLAETCRSTINTYAPTASGQTAIKEQQFHNSSYTTSAPAEIHAIQVTVPVAIRKELDIWGQPITLNNQVQRTATVSKLGITLREILCNDGSCSIGIQTMEGRPRNADNPELEVERLVTDVYDYLLTMGYLVDRKAYKVGYAHIWRGDKRSVDQNKRYGHSTFALGRERAKFTPKDPDQEALVWMDQTPSKGKETNDKDYAEKDVKMPLYVHEIHEIVKRLENHTFQQNGNQAQETIFPAGKTFKWNLPKNTPYLGEEGEVGEQFKRFGEAFR